MSKIVRLGLFACLLSALPAFAAPAVSFDPTGVVISQLTPGGRVAVAGYSRSGSTVFYRLRQLDDGDGDGEVRYELGSEVPSASVFVAVDLTSGSFGAARPEGAFQPEPLPVGQIVADAQGQPLQLHLRMTGSLPGLFLVVRPGVGAWGERVGDSGPADADGRPNGFLLVSPSPFLPLSAETPPAPASFRAGDVVVEIEVSDLEVTAGTVPSDAFSQTIGFAAAEITVPEGQELASLMVTRQGTSLAAATVDYIVPNTRRSGTLSWPAGDASPRAIEVPLLDDGVRNPDRILEVLLFNATGGAVLRQPPQALVTVTDDEGPRESRLSSQQVLCDAARAEGFLARTGLDAPGAADGHLTVWFTPTGDLAGLANAGALGQPERHMAFSSNLEESTLLRNPERPQLFSVSLTRNDLNSDLVPAASPGRLTVTLNPTLAAAPATGLLTIDNVAGTAGRLTDAKPGRGLADLAEPCHRTASPRDAHLFAVLAKTVRAMAAGADSYEIAILRGEAPGSYFLDVYPYAPDGRSLGRLAASLDAVHAGDGTLEQGTLRLLPRCAPGQSVHCTTVNGAASLGLVPPVGPGVPRPAAAVQVSTSGLQQAAFSWAGLLAESTWGPSPAQEPPPVPVRDSGALDCDRARLRGFLDRLTATASGTSKPVSVNLTFSASGDFSGLAFTGNGPTPEHHLAFSTNPEEMTLLRNPRRPQLGTVSLTRNALASDLVAMGDPDRLSLTVNPTLSPSPAPSSLLAIDNLQGAAGLAASARPGRGIAPLLERCHGGFLEQDAHVLQLLSRIVRVEVEGASLVKTAIYPYLEGGGSYGIDVYPFGADGSPQGHIALVLEIGFDSTTGEPATGFLRVQQRCPDEDCTDFEGQATVELIHPAGAGMVREPSPVRLTVRPNEFLTADLGALFEGTTWARRLPAAGRGVGERIALGGSVLFIGAHPGDEILAAPLLAEVCVARGARCTFLVATRGGDGSCQLPGGCAPDLSTVRAREMEAAAALFGAELVQWDFPPGDRFESPNVILQTWAAREPQGFSGLYERVLGVLGTAHPTAVLTFDPRHGSTCDPNHQAVADLLSSTLRETGAPAPEVYWLETRRASVLDLSAGFAPAVPDDPAVQIQNGAPFWPFLLADAGAHASQVSPEDLAALGAVPASGRIVPVLARSRARFDDSQYDFVCNTGSR